MLTGRWLRLRLLGAAGRLGIDTRSAENARFARLAGASNVLYGLSSVLGVVLNILLARLLGPAGLGVYAAAFAAISVVLVVTNTAVPTVLVRWLPMYREAGDAARVKGCVRWAARHVTLAGLAGGGLVAAVAAAGWGAPGVAATYQAAAVVMVLWAIGGCQSAVLQGFERPLAARSPDLIVRPGLLIVLLLAWPLAGGGALTPALAMLLQAAAFLGTVLVGAALLRRLVRPALATTGAPAYAFGPWYGAAMALTTTQLAEAVLAQAALLILPHFAAAAEVGLYRVAVAAAALVSLPATAVMMALPPIIARLHAAGDRPALQSLLTTSARLAALLSLPMALACLLAAEPLIRLLFGQQFAAAAPLLQILTIGHLAMVAAGAASWALRMTGHERQETQATMIAAGCQLAALGALIPVAGSLGAAMGQAGGLATLALLLLWRVLHGVGCDPSVVGRLRSPSGRGR